MYHQVCVWEGTLVGQDKIVDFENFIFKTFGCRAKYLEEVKTNPDLRGGRPVRGTGNRNDLFFAIHEEDVDKFAVPRLQYHIRWWEDVLGNGSGYLYPKEILTKYKPGWNLEVIESLQEACNGN